ncbi:chemotaxis protein CheA [Desulfurispirillum indicum]|uniref:histidine kinase n=1 Tax=Desulfurispirillum indicum (strain ATCC BAA-1389 / DSM 22839 / S5) TaxID=653733 RepID=E6W5Q9_DESIS|nr:chemotaxis protein CheA [Desulfurispirillum indicum]ADU66090.1 CheW domain protein [Desulfurispirillum indicum S5]UCZ55496.1 chemotaxis protein CheA [Desulfurispirillum indicum]
MGHEDTEIIEDFLVETDELLEKLDQDLIELENSPDNYDLLNAIFRCAHTVKGTSGFLGFTTMAELTHHAEDVLNKLRKGDLVMNPHTMDILLEAFDLVKSITEDIRSGRGDSQQDISGVVERLHLITEGKEGEVVLDHETPPAPQPLPAEETAAVPPAVSPRPAAAVAATAPVADPHPIAPASEPTKKTSPPAPAAKNAPKQAAADDRKKGEQTIRVDVDRLDALMNLVGELVLGRNRILQLTSQMESDRDNEHVEALSETSAQLSLITTELQMAVMKTRMLPVGKVFNRFPRMVRDLSRELKKDIELIITGEDTELDKSVVEEIGDPLVHLIRNSCDHGVETPEERKAVGKPATGKVHLSAFHEGNHIVIEIKDDGKGIDADVIKAKAVEKGVITEAEASRMGKTEALNLIFAPGFSTAAKVTDVSGRGVGMDVVRTNIEKLNGLIVIDTDLGKGSTFTIKIPLTLAIIQVLLVGVSDESYAIPLVSVVETVKVTRGEIKTIERKQVLRLRDEVVPLVKLSGIFDVPTEEKNDVYIVILGLAERRIGLIVDTLLGQEEIVIKTLGDYLKGTPGITGATIMGDGRVNLIVDVASMIEMAAEGAAS